MSRTFIFTVRTKSGIKFHIEASSANEAEQRARHPVIVRELALMLSCALSEVDSVDGPVHLLNDSLVFRDEIFS